MSTLLIALTGQSVPRDLVIVRLRVVVEGVVFERDLEADINLEYRFTWDRRNAYNQKVYGVVTATGKVFVDTTNQINGVWAFITLVEHLFRVLKTRKQTGAPPRVCSFIRF